MRTMPQELIALVADIKKHNDVIFENTPRNQKIDFTKTKKSWGTDVVPKHLFIDLDKEYITLDGRKVELQQLVMTNGINEVTFPIKGTITTKKVGKKDKVECHIWTLDGRYDVSRTNDPKNIVLKV